MVTRFWLWPLIFVCSMGAMPIVAGQNDAPAFAVKAPSQQIAEELRQIIIANKVRSLSLDLSGLSAWKKSSREGITKFFHDLLSVTLQEVLEQSTASNSDLAAYYLPPVPLCLHNSVSLANLIGKTAGDFRVSLESNFRHQVRALRKRFHQRTAKKQPLAGTFYVGESSEIDRLRSAEAVEALREKARELFKNSLPQRPGIGQALGNPAP